VLEPSPRYCLATGHQVPDPGPVKTPVFMHSAKALAQGATVFLCSGNEPADLLFAHLHADKCRAGELKWRGAPPGLSPELAEEFMAKLKTGSTAGHLRRAASRAAITGPTWRWVWLSTWHS